MSRCSTPQQSAWLNSKRQARRSVSLYEKYKDRVQFVIIDLDKQRPAEQQELVRQHYRGSIPRVAVLDAEGNAVYNQAGEISESEVSRLPDGLHHGPPKQRLSALGDPFPPLPLIQAA